MTTILSEQVGEAAPGRVTKEGAACMGRTQTQSGTWGSAERAVGVTCGPCLPPKGWRGGNYMQQQTSAGFTPNMSDVSWLCQIATVPVIPELHHQLPGSLAVFQVFLGLWNSLCLGLAKRRWWPTVWGSDKADVLMVAPGCCGV